MDRNEWQSLVVVLLDRASSPLRNRRTWWVILVLPIRRGDVCVCVYIRLSAEARLLFIWLVVCSACARLSFVLYGTFLRFPSSFFKYFLLSGALVFLYSLSLSRVRGIWIRIGRADAPNQFTTLKRRNVENRRAGIRLSGESIFRARNDRSRGPQRPESRHGVLPSIRISIAATSKFIQ